VHPDYQGKGHGQALVKWGVDESAREGVCACVIAADGKDGFYGKFGFVKVGMANVGPLAENGIKGGTIMFAHI
jgi:predicted N-acetyltransferase YhbS